jgi:hypothetical protein
MMSEPYLPVEIVCRILKVDRNVKAAFVCRAWRSAWYATFGPIYTHHCLIANAALRFGMQAYWKCTCPLMQFMIDEIWQDSKTQYTKYRWPPKLFSSIGDILRGCKYEHYCVYVAKNARIVNFILVSTPDAVKRGERREYYVKFVFHTKDGDENSERLRETILRWCYTYLPLKSRCDDVYVNRSLDERRTSPIAFYN